MEENSFAILMFIFGGALLLYASILYWAKDSKMIPRNFASKQTGERYARRVAKIIALVSLAPMICGAAVLNGKVKYTFIVLIVAFAVLITAGVRTFTDEGETEEEDEEKDNK